ncbi:ComEC/Rec2 family competence protein [Rhodanobacter sp. FW106-PBR-LB-2-11]|uniref:ComEC/Rec2 family competence protein n=1 Tax=Rhodanobacter sp. FW106-PBR-LB-2-11 TaxID=1524463 RepID=UPI0034E3A5F7
MRRLTATTAAVALLAGVLLVQWLPQLPPRWCLGLPLPIIVLLAWRCPRWRWLAWLLCGIVWAAWRGGLAMESRLPPALEGRDLAVVGTIADLPLAHPDASRFTLHVERATADGEPVALRGRVTVTWYEDAPALPPCSRWRLQLRLRRPRGLIDPGGADSERSALERGIVACRLCTRRSTTRRSARPGAIDGVRGAVARGIAARARPPRRGLRRRSRWATRAGCGRATGRWRARTGSRT